MEQQIRFCTTSDGIRIAYATSGSGPPVVRVLGWFTHLEFEWESGLWRGLNEGMSSNFTWVRYDGRGMGLSDRDVRDFSLDKFVRDLEAVIGALGLERFALYGLSQGGPPAIKYAVEHPERVTHLVLYGSFPRVPFQSSQLDTMLTLIRQGWGSNVPAHRQFFTGLFMPDADTEAIRAFNELQRVSASPETVATMLDEYVRKTPLDVTDLLPRVTVPTLVVHLRGDAIVPFELGRELAAGIPGARFLPLDGRNHAIPPDDRAGQALQKAVEEFLLEGSPRPERATSSGAGAIRSVLFTDLEGSTGLTQRLGDLKARALLKEHEKIVRAALNDHGGSEIKTLGDGFMASFASATSAVRCAVAIQRAFDAYNSDASEPMKIRVGISAGEPLVEGNDLFGTSVIMAARIAGRARGGQILIADVVRGLIAGKGFSLRDEGETVLEGFDEPARLYSVEWNARNLGVRS